jgi:hypothetical protein
LTCVSVVRGIIRKLSFRSRKFIGILTVRLKHEQICTITILEGAFLASSATIKDNH